MFFCYFLELLFRFIQIPQIERHILDYKNNIWYPNLIVSNKYDIELEEILSPFSLIAWEFAKLWRDPKVFRMLKTWESQESILLFFSSVKKKDITEENHHIVSYILFHSNG